MSALFLTADELAYLTGRKLKALQVAELRRMGVPFRVNACGRPVVTRAAIEGRIEEQPKPTTWRSALAKIQHAA